MQFFSTLAMVTLATLAVAVPVPNEGALFVRDYPSSDYNCPSADFQGCSLDGTMISCSNSVATLYTCTGGCQLNCPDSGPCNEPTCNGAAPA